MTELEQMYVSGVVKKTPSDLKLGELNKRNKYFDQRGSIFGLSNETPTLIAQDQD